MSDVLRNLGHRCAPWFWVSIFNSEQLRGNESARASGKTRCDMPECTIFARREFRRQIVVSHVPATAFSSDEPRCRRLMKAGQGPPSKPSTFCPLEERTPVRRRGERRTPAITASGNFYRRDRSYFSLKDSDPSPKQTNRSTHTII